MKRTLGRSGIEISALGMGCWAIGGPFWAGRTVAQGALAWLWARSPQTIPIPGFRTARQVEENAGAMAFGSLLPDQMREIHNILERPS